MQILLGCRHLLRIQACLICELLVDAFLENYIKFGRLARIWLRGPDAAQPSPLGLPMTEELLADSFLKRLFARFYDMLHIAGGSVNPQLQARTRHSLCSNYELLRGQNLKRETKQNKKERTPTGQ